MKNSKIVILSIPLRSPSLYMLGGWEPPDMTSPEPNSAHRDPKSVNAAMKRRASPSLHRALTRYHTPHACSSVLCGRACVRGQATRAPGRTDSVVACPDSTR